MKKIAFFLLCISVLVACRKEVNLVEQPFVKYFSLEDTFKDVYPMDIVPAIDEGQFVLLSRTLSRQKIISTQPLPATPGLSLMQFDRSGIKSKSSLWDGHYVYPSRLVADPNKGRYILLTNNCKNFFTDLNICNCTISNVDANLTIQPYRNFIGHYGKDILPLENGNYLFIGATSQVSDKSTDSNYVAALDIMDVYIAELSADFSVVWDTVYGGTGNDVAQIVKEVNQGFYISINRDNGLQATGLGYPSNILLFFDKATKTITNHLFAFGNPIKDIHIKEPYVSTIIENQSSLYSETNSIIPFTSRAYTRPQVALGTSSNISAYHYILGERFLERDDQTVFILGSVTDYPMVDILSLDAMFTDTLGGNSILPVDYSSFDLNMDPLTSKLYAYSDNFSPFSGQQALLPEGTFTCGLVTDQNEVIAVASIKPQTSNSFNKAVIIKTDMNLRFESTAE